MLTNPRTRKRALFASFGVFALALATMIGTGVYQFGYSHEELPPVPMHSDLTRQPMTTFADSLNINTPEDISQVPNSTCAPLASNWVAKENAQPGISMTTKDWQQLDLQSAAGSALWLNKTSAGCGDEIKIHASLYGTRDTKFINGPRTIQAMRIGWYQGSGAREVWNSGPISLKNQKVIYPKNALRMVDTKWPTTATIKVGANWTPGFYLFVTRAMDGHIENAAPLVIRSPLGSSKLLLVHSFLTWSAYNSFGGRSAYFGVGATQTEMRTDRSRVVSLDRPIVGSGGFAVHRDAISLVQFLEREGINVDQESDIDIDSWPSITKSYNGLVLGGHPEYFTRRIFDCLLAARNSGINLAILGGNTAVWQTRLTASPVGENRRLIIYRNPKEDPVQELSQVSIAFSDGRLNVPGTLITGSLTDGVHVYGDMKATSIPSWLKIPSGSSITGISPDSEVEQAVKTVAAAPNVHILFSGNMHYRDSATVGSKRNISPIAQSLWFTTPSGSAVFNAGITTWSCDLIATCAYSTVDEKSRTTLDSVTKQVLALWQTKGIGKTLK